jgi:hypothetical protein
MVALWDLARPRHDASDEYPANCREHRIKEVKANPHPTLIELKTTETIYPPVCGSAAANLTGGVETPN